MARVFISHSSRDTEAASRIFAWLREQGFDQTFLDVDKDRGIQPGAEWEKVLYREVERSQAVILILTKNWLDSKWCFAEWAQARALGKAIFPVVEAPSGERLVGGDLQTIDLTTDRDGALDRLGRALTEVALQSPEGFELPKGTPPFPGLNAFDEKHAAVFFGRDDAIVRLIETLRRRRSRGGERLIALLGASGSGKSSLVRAGLLPRLKRDRENWIVVPAFRPEFDPHARLIDALLSLIDDSSEATRYSEQLASDAPQHALADIARSLRRQAGSLDAQILISIDQGEELFTTAAREPVQRFWRLLSAMLVESMPYIAVAAIRSDYLGDLQAAPELSVLFEAFPLEPMPLDRISMLVRGPARVAGVSVDDDLIAAIAHDAATPDALPLLAFTLRELYERHGGDGHLSLAEYESLGDRAAGLNPLENAIRLAAEEALPTHARSADDARALREAFVPGLVRVNAEGEFVRRPAALTQLPERARPLIDRLVSARLLVRRAADGESANVKGAIVEVAHEALFRVWPELAAWLEEERDFLIGKGRLETALEDWRNLPEGSRDKGLLAGVALDRARQWLIEHPHRLTKEEQHFVRESIRRDDSRRTRARRVRLAALAGSLTAALVFAVLGALALQQRNRAAFALKNEEAQRKLAVDASRRADERAAEAEQHLYFANIAAATAAVERDEVFNAHEFLDDCPEGLRRWEWYWLAERANPGTMTFGGHDGEIQTAVFSPDSHRVLTAAGDNTARIWDTITGRGLVILEGHEDVVGSAIFSPTGERALTISRDRTARIWDAATGQQLAALRHEGLPTSAAFSPDGSRVLVGTWGGARGPTDQHRVYRAHLWDAESGEELVVLPGQNRVSSASFSPDGERVITASNTASNNAARVWAANSGKTLLLLQGHESKVVSASFSPSGDHLVTASADRTARVWDAYSGAELMVLRGHERDVVSAMFSPEGDRVLTASMDDTARIWNVETGRELMVLRGHKEFLKTATFSPDGEQVLTTAADSTARLWDLPDGRQVSIFQPGVYSAAFSPEGNRIVTVSLDNNVRIVDLDRGKAAIALRGHRGAVVSACFDAKSDRILTGAGDNTARIWEAQTGRQVAVLEGHDGPVRSGVFSPDGSRALTGSDDGTARIWDSRTGDQLLILAGHQSAVNSVAFSPGGNLVVTAAFGAAQVWETKTGRKGAVLQGHEDGVRSAVFSPDGTRVLTASYDHTARIWDAGSGEELFVLRGHEDEVTSAVFGPDGRRILTSSGDGTARIWDAASGRQLVVFHSGSIGAAGATFNPSGNRVLTVSIEHAQVWDADDGRKLAILTGHEPPSLIVSATFNPGGERILTASWDGTARIWDADSGRELIVLRGHLDKLRSADFSPDGHSIVTASNDRTARIWHSRSYRERFAEIEAARQASSVAEDKR